MDGIRPATRIYFTLMAIATIVCFAFAVSRGSAPSLRVCLLTLFLSGLLVLAERKPMPFGQGSNLTMDTSIVLTAVLVLPPWAAILVAILGSSLSNFPRRTDWYEIIFNTAQTGLQAAAGALVLTVGSIWEPTDPFTSPIVVVPVVLAGLAMHVANTVAVSIVLTLESGEDFRTAWFRLAAPNRTEAIEIATQWALALLAAVVADGMVWALILLVAPGLLVLSSLDRHARLRIRAEADLIHHAFHDSLTGLPNRTRLIERMEAALSQPDTSSVTILFLDLDRFKLINDTLGHEAGDRLLVTVAERLKTCVRATDTVARLGGDEFVVLLDGEGRSVDGLAARITEELAAPIDLMGREIVVTTSIGVARTGKEILNAGDLLRNADVALYRAKENGRNGVALYDSSMGSAVNQRAELEESLRRALAKREWRLAFQPQVDLLTGEIISVETLLRWQHPKRGLLMPVEFLDVAEETGLILPIGRWVLNEACATVRRWSVANGKPVILGVNIGPRQLNSPSLFDDIQGALRTSGLPAGQLRLEIAENAAMTHPEMVLHVLRNLRDLGVGVQLDDFGSGRSSLAHLARFPVQSLMLDRALVTGNNRNEGTEMVIRAVVGLARELGLSVGAKGIEEAEQARVLSQLGCQIGQGHHFGRPGEISEVMGEVSTGSDFNASSSDGASVFTESGVSGAPERRDVPFRGLLPQPA